jgi:hypothetical protein
MRADTWAGLVTNASPFALPPGAAVEQVNLNCSVPGQLQTRNGMRPLAVTPEDRTSIVHCHAVQLPSGPAVIAQRADGTVVVLGGIAPAAAPSVGFDPQLSVTSGQIATSYTHRYVDGRYGAAQESPEPAPQNPLVEALDGGESDTTAWPFTVDSVSGCPVSGKLAVVDGGVARDDGLPPDVRESELCET